MRGKHIEPSITETRFSCPHCGTLTVQHWYSLHGDTVTDVDRERSAPRIWTKENFEKLKQDLNIPKEMKEKFTEEIEKELTGKIYLRAERKSTYVKELVNLLICVCEECEEAAIWHRDRLMHPASCSCPPAHEDMPDPIVKDYNEARAIIDLSARGAAALARLCIEKLCIHLLGKDVGSIDAAIGQLVAQDLDERIQKKLDIVRVNGNALVHGGVMEDEDDRNKAVYLLELVNQIVDEAITRPERLKAEYSKLPPEKLQGIEDRPKRTPLGA
jgi:hypothetical protein